MQWIMQTFGVCVGVEFLSRWREICWFYKLSVVAAQSCMLASMRFHNHKLIATVFNNVFINQVTALSWSYLTIHYIMDPSKLIDLLGSNWVLFYYVLLHCIGFTCWNFILFWKWTLSTIQLLEELSFYIYLASFNSTC